MFKPIIAISIGDSAGVGPELAVKVAGDPLICGICKPILCGPKMVISQAVEQFMPNFSLKNFSTENAKSNEIVFEDLGLLNLEDFPKGIADSHCGQIAYDTIVKTTKAVIDKKFDAIVTAPVCKEAINKAGINFTGHTELIAGLCGISNFVMMQSDKDFRVVFATCHIPLMSVGNELTQEKIINAGKLLNKAIKAEGLADPLIGVCGLNPHAGEGGFMGREDIEIVAPVILELNKLEIKCEGPFPADTIFVPNIRKKYAGIISMYHDQGHIPFKIAAFDRGVNSTLGLPIIRTSVDHGTAFDIAWQGKADTGSLMQAVKLAVHRSL